MPTPPSPEDPAAKQPSTFGTYVLIRRLGEGSQGSVFAAEQTGLQRWVALKILHKEVSEDVHLRRFQREIRISGRLNHRNIVKILDGGVLDGVPYLAMEYLEGQTLDRLLESGSPLSLAAAITIATDLADGLDCLHSSDLVHRDIKPANVMITAGSVPKLLDFGLSRSIRSTRLTEAGGLVGTPYYLAPELLEEGTASPASDMWALGCILYQMVTGRMPFPDLSSGGWVRSILMDEIPDPRSLNPQVPPELSTTILSLLQRAPDQRLASAAFLRESLRKLNYGRTSLPEMANFDPPPGEPLSGPPGEKAPRTLLTRPAPARSWFPHLLVLLAVVAVWGVWLALRFQRDRAPIASLFQELTHRTNREMIQQLEQEARDNPGDMQARLKLGWLHTELGNLKVGLPLLAEVQGKAKDSSMSHLAAARSATALGRHVEALAAARIAFASNPEAIDARCYLGLCLMKLEWREDAVLTLKEALVRLPENVWIRSSYFAARQAIGAEPAWEVDLRRDIGRYPRWAAGHTALAWWLMTRARWREAIREYRQALALDPSEVKAVDVLGTQLLRSGKRVEALEMVRKSQELFPAARAPMLVVVADAIGRRDLGAAENVLRRSLREGPAMAFDHYQLSSAVLLPQQKFKQAEAECREGLECDGGSVGGHLALAYVLRSAGDFPGAEAECRRAVAVAPQHLESVQMLQTNIVSQGDVARAIREIRQMAKKQPKNESAVLVLARSLASVGDLEGAVTAYRQAIALAPTHILARRELCNILELTEQRDEADHLMQETLKADPQNFGLCWDFAKVYERQRRDDLAEELVRRTVAIAPGEVIPKVMLAAYLRRRGRTEAARAIIDETVRMNSLNMEEVESICTELETQKAIAKAETLRRQLIVRRPDFPAARPPLGHFLLRQGRGRDAIAELNKAASADPTDLSALVVLRSAYAAVGDRAGEERILRDLVTRIPWDPYFLELTELLKGQGRFGEAATIYERARKLSLAAGMRHVVQLRLGVCYVRLRRKAEAMHVFKVLIDETPTPVATRIDVARSLRDGGYIPEADEILTPITQLKDPTFSGLELLRNIKKDLHDEAGEMQLTRMLAARFPQSPTNSLKALQMLTLKGTMPELKEMASRFANAGKEDLGRRGPSVPLSGFWRRFDTDTIVKIEQMGETLRISIAQGRSGATITAKRKRDDFWEGQCRRKNLETGCSGLSKVEIRISPDAPFPLTLSEFGADGKCDFPVNHRTNDTYVRLDLKN